MRPLALVIGLFLWLVMFAASILEQVKSQAGAEPALVASTLTAVLGTIVLMDLTYKHRARRSKQHMSRFYLYDFLVIDDNILDGILIPDDPVEIKSLYGSAFKYICFVCEIVAISYLVINMAILRFYVLSDRENMNSLVLRIADMFSMDLVLKTSMNAFLMKSYTISAVLFVVALITRGLFVYITTAPVRPIPVNILFRSSNIAFWIGTALVLSTYYVVILSCINIRLDMLTMMLYGSAGWLSLVAWWVSAYVSGTAVLFHFRARSNRAANAAASP